MNWMLMPFRRYFEFSGRSRRMEYWMFALLMTVVYGVGLALMFAGGFDAMYMVSMSGAVPFSPEPVFFVGAAIVGLFGLVSFIPAIAVTVRRLHDRDLSGWWYLGVIVASMIPFVGWIASIALLVVMCLAGTPGANRFGPDPKGASDPVVFG